MQLWCPKCKRETRQKLLKKMKQRVCVAYDGGGGEYETFHKYIYRCGRCKKRTTR